MPRTLYHTTAILSILLAAACSGFSQTQADYITQIKNKPRIPVSATNPLFLSSHFRDDDDVHLRVDLSRDALNWTPIMNQGLYAPPDGIIRDPSVMYVPNATNPLLPGTFQFLYDSDPTNDCSVLISTTSDLINFTFRYIDLTQYFSGCKTAWAPEWFHDPVSGNYYFFDALGNVTDVSSTTPKFMILAQYNPATQSIIGTPQTVTVAGTTQSNIFDPFPYYLNGIYYLFYVDQQPTSGAIVTQPIVYATATAISGPYSQIQAPGTDCCGLTTPVSTPSVTSTYQTEAPTLIPLPNGCVRVQADTWIYPQLYNSTTGTTTAVGRQYQPQYRDSCPSSGALFSPGSFVNSPSLVNIGKYEHGTTVVLTDQVSSSIAYNAQDHFSAQNNVVGNFCINITPCPYTLGVSVLQGFAGNISTQQVPVISSMYWDGNAATLAACAPYPQECWLNPPGIARWNHNYSGDGGFGQFQLNQYDDTGIHETSIGLFSGAQQMGSPPVPGAIQGWNGIWSVGMNNTALQNGPNSGVGNNRFFTYNAGLFNSIYVDIAIANVNSTGLIVTRVSGVFAGTAPETLLSAGNVVLVNNQPCTVAALPAPTANAFNCASAIAPSQTGVFVAYLRQGGIPFQVSPIDGLGRIGYGLGFGGGANEAYSTTSLASLYALHGNPGVLNLDGGLIPQTAVNTAGTAVTWVSGPQFTATSGTSVFINGGSYFVAPSPSPTATSITLLESAGTQYGVQYMPHPTGELRLGGVTFNCCGSLDSFGSTLTNPLVNAGNGAPGSFNAKVNLGSVVATVAAPTVAAGQIGYGSTTVASSFCGSLSGAAGCIVVNVAGTVHYVPYW